ncbi:unnamed protein product [Sphenostylis stenocarpa]|uniref:Uncharacterized protein n=1 Tax=Sphenostylis stenocarpa TaxID=92480 RepID=A0AA86SSI5_9FABA|nr:unnamed protein product [Sphenostylis stenocarpa]
MHKSHLPLTTNQYLPNHSRLALGAHPPPHSPPPHTFSSPPQISLCLTFFPSLSAKPARPHSPALTLHLPSAVVPLTSTHHLPSHPFLSHLSSALDPHIAASTTTLVMCTTIGTVSHACSRASSPPSHTHSTPSPNPNHSPNLGEIPSKVVDNPLTIC